MDIQDEYNHEEGNCCLFCGVEIEDDKNYCSRECYASDYSERV